ncbi:hypothetical protein [Streptomyces sp. NPDC096095]|uniref:hypothetical protein n=1 Tax=Streptomyces sp. NPDC096095 TaxID=3155545 RepID=UPI00331A241E
MDGPRLAPRHQRCGYRGVQAGLADGLDQQHPDLPDLWPAFLGQEGVFWTVWLRPQVVYPVLPVLLALSAWALSGRRAPFLPLALAAAGRASSTRPGTRTSTNCSATG